MKSENYLCNSILRALTDTATLTSRHLYLLSHLEISLIIFTCMVCLVLLVPANTATESLWVLSQSLEIVFCLSTPFSVFYVHFCFVLDFSTRGWYHWFLCDWILCQSFSAVWLLRNDSMNHYKLLQNPLWWRNRQSSEYKHKYL